MGKSKKISKSSLPGDYFVIKKPYKIRGRKTTNRCLVCQVFFEHLWIYIPSHEAENSYYWAHLCCRCPECGLKHN